MKFEEIYRKLLRKWNIFVLRHRSGMNAEFPTRRDRKMYEEALREEGRMEIEQKFEELLRR